MYQTIMNFYLTGKSTNLLNLIKVMKEFRVYVLDASNDFEVSGYDIENWKLTATAPDGEKNIRFFVRWHNC